MYTETIRIYPNKTQCKLIDDTIEDCRRLYNYFLQLNIDQYNLDKTFLWKNDLCKYIHQFNFTVKIHSQVKQNVATRMDYALHRIKTGNKFPKFKSPGQYRSFTYPQASGFKLDLVNSKINLGRLFGDVKVKISRIPSGIPKTCCIKKYKSGKYYVFISFEDKNIPKIIPIRFQDAIGIDLGVSRFLTDEKGNYISSPRFIRKNLKKLAKAQRELSRKQKGSRNREKARLRVSRIQEKIANSRRDFHFKVAHYLVNTYDQIMCEDLEVSTMFPGKSRQSVFARRSLRDVGLYQFLIILEQMCKKYSCQLIKVNPSYTTQMCHVCGTLVKKKLSERTHICPHCGLVIDRDVNAAINIFRKGKNLPVGTTGRSDSDRMLVEMIIPGI